MKSSATTRPLEDGTCLALLRWLEQPRPTPQWCRKLVAETLVGRLHACCESLSSWLDALHKKVDKRASGISPMPLDNSNGRQGRATRAGSQSVPVARKDVTECISVLAYYVLIDCNIHDCNPPSGNRKQLQENPGRYQPIATISSSGSGGSGAGTVEISCAALHNEASMLSALPGMEQRGANAQSCGLVGNGMLQVRRYLETSLEWSQGQ